MASQNPFELIDARLSNIENILLDLRLSNKKSFESESSELLTVPQAAEFLRLSVPTIYGLLHRRLIPAMKRGKRVYFKRAELLSYIEEGRIDTLSEIAAKPTFSARQRSK